MSIEFSAFGRAQGAPRPLVLIAGPCVIESEEHVHRMARGIRDAVGEFVFKASFDKANRTSLDAYRGPGPAEGLRILGGLKAEGFGILTDIHEPAQAEPAGWVYGLPGGWRGSGRSTTRERAHGGRRRAAAEAGKRRSRRKLRFRLAQKSGLFAVGTNASFFPA